MRSHYNHLIISLLVHSGVFFTFAAIMPSIFTKYKNTFIICLGIIPFLILAIFTQPIAEDFGFATMAQKRNFIDLLSSSYQTMNGRYVANIFMFASPLTFNSFIVYKLIPALLIAGNLICFYHFFGQLIRKLNKHLQLTLAVAAVAIYLNGMPIISEGLYWYTGSSIYYIANLFLLFFLSQLLSFSRSPKLSYTKYIICIIFAFLACGFNETQTAIISLFMLVLAVMQYYIKHPLRVYTLALTVLVIAFALLMILAPGNSLRASMYTQGAGEVIRSTGYSFAQLGRFLFDWTLSIPLLTSTILFVVNYDKISANSSLIKNGFYLNKWFALLMLFSTILISVFPAYWFTGILGQHRTLNVGYFAFLMVWFICLSAWLKEHKYIIDRFQPISQYKKYVIFLFALGCLFTDNGYFALDDLFSGKAKAFNDQLEYRHELLAKTSNTSGVKLLLTPLESKPKCLFVSDISEDPNYWMNLGYNDYFRLDSVKITVEEPE